MGGSFVADKWNLSREEFNEKFFIQVNHHIGRRVGNQPCDWLIARKGSGMRAEVFRALPEPYQKRIKIISAQVNEPELFEGWEEFCKEKNIPLFPFHEKGFINENPYHSSLEWCNQYWNEIGTNPFIGMLAVKMILMFPVRSLKLCGFDFFKTPEGVVRKQLSCHNITRQVHWLRGIYSGDFRLNIDKGLTDVFNSFGEIKRGITKTYDTDN